MSVGGAPYLARLTRQIASSSLSDECRATARQHLLDALACASIGCRLAAFRGLAALCGGLENGYARPGGGQERVGAADAGMLWAYAINASVFEDGSREGACHPAAVVIPAVIALSRDRGWDIIDKAVAAGYDVMVRLARCGNPQFSRRGFHPTAIVAPFGAAATAAVLLGHDPITTQNALSIAALGSSGLMAAFKSGPTQPLQVAWGVRNGLTAAFLAGGGQEGYGRIIEEGFFPAYLGHDPLVPLHQPLEYEYAVLGSYLKAYPGCRHLHPAIDAFAQVEQAHQISFAQIKAIRVGTYRIAVETEIHDLKNRGDAYFNLPYALAARAVLGNNNYDSFAERHFADARLLGLMKKIEVRIDPEIERRYPKQRGARVEVDTISGRSLAGLVEQPLGEPENPLPPAFTRAKFREAAGAFLAEDEMERVAGLLDLTGPPEAAANLFAAVCGSR